MRSKIGQKLLDELDNTLERMASGKDMAQNLLGTLAVCGSDDQIMHDIENFRFDFEMPEFFPIMRKYLIPDWMGLAPHGHDPKTYAIAVGLEDISNIYFDIYGAGLSTLIPSNILMLNDVYPEPNTFLSSYDSFRSMQQEGLDMKAGPFWLGLLTQLGTEYAYCAVISMTDEIYSDHIKNSRFMSGRNIEMVVEKHFLERDEDADI